MNIEVKRVACRACGVKLEIKNTTGDPVKLIRCPRCKATLKVIFQQPAQQPVLQPARQAQPVSPAMPRSQRQTPVNHAPDATVFPRRSAVSETSDATVFPGRKTASAPLPMLVCDDVEYRLKIGQNVIGRRADNNTVATVPVETDDRTMSRGHALIKVVKLANGNYKSIISSFQNKNSLIVNDVELLKDEELVLTDGTVVEMGLTTMTYVQKTVE